MVDWRFVLDRLAEARNYWLATISPDGRPHVAPVWGAFVDSDLFLETSARTRKARNMAERPNVAVHVEAGDETVIVEGEAQPFRPTPELGAALSGEFRRKYAGYEPTAEAWDEGGLYRVVPSKVLAWRDMPTATRWRFRH
ncbi:MAG TPA: pyridoxamine 5'-phosphate oxidase family protein [Candidatus Limnocylindria bacterium]|nr:pyridoxamine 5'-phosphate oxidase family protein [Candidatus Limnocylindria bacterium]